MDKSCRVSETSIGFFTISIVNIEVNIDIDDDNDGSGDSDNDNDSGDGNDSGGVYICASICTNKHENIQMIKNIYTIPR